MFLPHVYLIFKKISPKTFGPHCVYHITVFLKLCEIAAL
jgi:hypothetical protein